MQDTYEELGHRHSKERLTTLWSIILFTAHKYYIDRLFCQSLILYLTPYSFLEYIFSAGGITFKDMHRIVIHLPFPVQMLRPDK